MNCPPVCTHGVEAMPRPAFERDSSHAATPDQLASIGAPRRACGR